MTSQEVWLQGQIRHLGFIKFYEQQEEENGKNVGKLVYKGFLSCNKKDVFCHQNSDNPKKKIDKSTLVLFRVQPMQIGDSPRAKHISKTTDCLSKYLSRYYLH